MIDGVGQGLAPCLLVGGKRFSMFLASMLVWAVSAQAGSLTQAFDAFGVQQPKVSKPAPRFSLDRLAGGKEALNDVRGRVVLLTFWARWCTPCRHEMPQIEALWKEYRNQGFIVLGVNVDRGNRDDVVGFVHSLHLTFPVLFDTDGSVRNRYEVRALPTSYLIGRDGKIIGRIIGERDWSSPKAQTMMAALTEQGETRK